MCVIVAFLVNHSDEKKQSFHNALRLVRAGNVEDDGYGCYSTGSALDALMRHITENSFANTQYLSFRLASALRQQLVAAWVAAALKLFDLNDYEENEKVQSFARKWLGESPCEEEQEEEFEFVPVPMENKG